ncbi:DUF4124 domain-containing protein [Geomonas sp. Red32]|uniref:DUF4124 domain-containing protein n=1 Tax=Geomonas sp. Red32 TaxID=2912856 RepID=UPI00202D0D0B|nr:DUF4124 domain-containing protein [Geomonas sp. Red32]MCM0083306.1 DUF4124 domain-containing protein [Geomonas sp. Red32]
MFKVAVCILLLLAFITNVQAEIFRCEDREGKLHFTDILPFSNQSSCTYNEKDQAKIDKILKKQEEKEKKLEMMRMKKYCKDYCSSLEAQGIVINQKKCFSNCLKIKK